MGWKPDPPTERSHVSRNSVDVTKMVVFMLMFMATVNYPAPSVLLLTIGYE